MPVRRAADPLNVQYVWDAIKNCHQQKQAADFDQIAKYVQKFTDCSQAQSELYIKQTLQDEMILDLKKGQKDSISGEVVESYRINKREEQPPPDDGHDWYCIECHLAGDVTCCRHCYRVFHTECSTNARHKQPDLFPKKNHINPSEMLRNNTITNNTVESENQENTSINLIDVSSNDSNGNINKRDYIYDETLCSLCNLAESDPGNGLDLNEFNHLLNFILGRIRSWVPDNLTSTLSQEPKHEWHTEAMMNWRAAQLFYQHMDMAHLELKIRTKEFSKFSQFQADVYSMLHNVAIFHGVESQEFGAAELMMKDMEHDISELQNCIDCYKHSNEKINNKWFCLPCRIPHKLVWAKQKGYPYWPAKVIRETETSCDVRFFSGKYERSILPKNCIKPITTSISQLQVKKSSSFNKAVEELRFHQRLLESPSEVAKILSQMPKRKKSLSKQKKTATKVQNVGFMKSPRKRLAQSTESNDVYDFQDTPLQDVRGRSDVVKRKSIENPEVPSQPKKKSNLNPVQLKPQNPLAKPSRDLHDIINISDIEDDRDASFNSMPDNCEFSDSGQEQVTSSTELDREDVFNSRETTDGVMQKLEQPYSDAVEKMRRKLGQCKDKKQLISIAMDCMQNETDRLTNDHNETLKRLFEAHNAQISETKKKQWCFNCEQDAIYHCCWNTAYCSPTCQQQHWQAEHKKVCRRKR